MTEEKEVSIWNNVVVNSESGVDNAVKDAVLTPDEAEQALNSSPNNDLSAPYSLPFDESCLAILIG